MARRRCASQVAGDPDQYVFAKLYSQTHLRSDRWYKVGRTILYGSLEDEVQFTSVRRLVEYEDYIQRLMRDAACRARSRSGSSRSPPNASTSWSVSSSRTPRN